MSGLQEFAAGRNRSERRRGTHPQQQRVLAHALDRLDEIRVKEEAAQARVGVPLGLPKLNGSTGCVSTLSGMPSWSESTEGSSTKPSPLVSTLPPAVTVALRRH